MKRQTLALALSVVALALNACSEPVKTGGNSKICADFKVAKASPGAAAAGGAVVLDECLKRWAYSLAPARDDAEVVAQAARAACGTQLASWNQQIATQPSADGEAASLMTGEPTTPLAEHNGYAERRALFYVVQARAGSCSAPPAKDGLPEGVG